MTFCMFRPRRHCISVPVFPAYAGGTDFLKVFQALNDNGATVVVIEHDLDMIGNADYIIDMEPGGGKDGGRIVASGTPEDIRNVPESRTGKYL